MICPSCGYKNIPGSDECESCHEDLASLDGVVPRSKIEKVLMRDPISHLKPRDAVVVGPAMTAQETVRKMNEKKVGCVLVVKDGEVEGILTERDILAKLLGPGKDLSKVPVAEIMTPRPQLLSENDTVAFAVNRMSVGGCRHVPILREGKSAGILSARDVLRYLSKLLPETT